MLNFILRISLVAFLLSNFSNFVFADEVGKTGQNAFTRAVKEPLSNIVTPVPNPHTTPCYSVVDCRKRGADLETNWQFNNNNDYSPKDYPDRCYTLGENGKYVYSSAACPRH